MKTFGTLTYHELPSSWAGDERGAWLVEGSPDLVIRLKRLFPRAEMQRRGGIALTHTDEIARDLEWVTTRWPLKMSSQDHRRLTASSTLHQQREEVVLSILDGHGRAGDGLLDPIRPARDYQRVAADLVLTTGALLCGDDLGLGKTMTGLLVCGAPEALPALVVCPTHLTRQWVGELKKTFPTLKAHIARTVAAYEPASRRDMRGHDPDLIVMSYSKLRGWGEHLAGKVRTVIFDEVQELRTGPGTDKYTAAARIADGAAFKLGLSATPIYNFGGEIHNIYAVLAPDRLGSRGEFAREWCGGSWWTDKVAVENPAALGTWLRDQGLFLRRTRAEVGRELPAVTRVQHGVACDTATLETMMEDAVDLAEVILGADRQAAFVASGEIDYKLRHATGVAKAPYVAEFVRLLLESEEKVVLFGWHRDVYDIWLDQLADFHPAMYTGSESPAQKDYNRARFLGGPTFAEQHPGTSEARVLLMSLRSGAGLDGLQEVAHVAVFGELDWSPGMHDQCIGRLHRDGQDDPVVAYFLTADDGADPLIAEALNLKRMQSEPLRDPNAKPFEAADNTDRIRQLAEHVLARRSGRRPR